MDPSLISDHLGDVHLIGVDTTVQLYAFEQPVRVITMDPGNVTYRWSRPLIIFLNTTSSSS